MSRRPRWFLLRLWHGSQFKPECIEHVFHRGCTWLGAALCLVALDGGADAFDTAAGAICYQARKLRDAEVGIFPDLDEELAEHSYERTVGSTGGATAVWSTHAMLINSQYPTCHVTRPWV